MITRPSTGTAGRALAAGILACLGAGVMAAVGQATAAFVLLGAVIVGAATVLERRRLAPVLWAGVAFTAPLQGVRVAPSIAVSDVLMVAASLSILPDVLHHRRRMLPSGTVTVLALLIISGLMGSFFATELASSLANLVKFVFAAAGTVAAMALWDPGGARLRGFAWLWFAGATASAAWAAATPRAYLGRALGLANHPNHFGLICVLALGLGLGLGLSSAGRARLAAFGGVGLVSVGIGLSGSRAAIISAAVTIAMTAVLARRTRLLVATGLVVILGSMAAVVGVVHVPDGNALSRFTGGGGSAASDLERKQTLSRALDSIAHHPFTGVGFDADPAHNIYLQALVVGGPIALLSFLCMAWLILHAGLRGVRAERSRSNGPLHAGLTAGFIGFLVSGAFNPMLWDRYLWTYFALVLVLAVSTGRSASTGPGRANAPGQTAAPPAFAPASGA